MPSSFVESRINQNLEVATEYFKALVSERTKNTTSNKINQSAGSIGFIPFNISFTMDGIGGIKIYNELSLDTSFLPPGYTNTTDFIITGINHKIQNGDWETDINVTLIPRTSPINNVITSSLQIFGQVETPPLTPPTTNTPTPSTLVGSKGLREALIGAGYSPGTFVFELALIQGTKEGYIKGSTNRPSRNNNPGNISYYDALKTLDPGVVLEPAAGNGTRRFAKFSTPELGAKALVEKFIKEWAQGNYPGTIVNGSSAASDTYRTTWVVPSNLKGISGKKVKLTLEQYFFIYAPPSENDTVKYINSVISLLNSKYPNLTKDSKLIDFI